MKLHHHQQSIEWKWNERTEQARKHLWWRHQRQTNSIQKEWTGQGKDEQRSRWELKWLKDWFQGSHWSVKMIGSTESVTKTSIDVWEKDEKWASGIVVMRTECLWEITDKREKQDSDKLIDWCLNGKKKEREGRHSGQDSVSSHCWIIHFVGLNDVKWIIVDFFCEIAKEVDNDRKP